MPTEPDDLSEEEEEQYWDREPIFYLAPEKVSLIADLLEKHTSESISASYSARELNDRKIYPWCWQEGDDEQQAFNRRHLADDFEILKTAFQSAKQEGDFLLVFAG